jgi:hypothetical protein
MLLIEETKTKAKWEIDVRVVFVYNEEEKRWIDAFVLINFVL